MNFRLGVLVTMILSAAALRLAMAGVPNVSPVTALALFSGAYLADRRVALVIPLVAMLLVDLVIGLHDMMLFVYGAFLLITLLGIFLSSRMNGYTIISASLISSIGFFFITNLGVWLVSGMYAMTWQGLVACYVAAIPFFHMTLLGDLFFVGLMFGSFALIERSMRQTEVVAG